MNNLNVSRGSVIRYGKFIARIGRVDRGYVWGRGIDKAEGCKDTILTTLDRLWAWEIVKGDMEI